MRNLRLGLAIASATTLVACGGSGGGSDDPQTVRINGLIDVSVSENSQVTVEASNAIDSIKAVEGSADLSFEFSGQEFTVSSVDLSRPAYGTYDVFMSRGNDTLIQRYEIVGINTSAQAVEEQAFSISENAEDLVNLAEDETVYRYLVDLSYLREELTPSERDSLIDDFNAADASTYTTAQSSIALLVSDYDQYQAGNISDSSLESRLNTVVSDLAAHDDYGLNMLRNIEPISGSVLSPLPASGIVYIDSQMRFSRYFDNSMLEIDSGTGEVVYASGFEILTPLTGL